MGLQQRRNQAGPEGGPVAAHDSAPGRGVGNADRLQRLSGGGPLPFRDQLEQAFGVDLGGISVVTGPEAQAACASIGANAYAMGEQIVCAEGSPSLETLAHEVAHIQQQGEVCATGGVGEASAAPEHEAEAAARQVASGGTVGPLTKDSGGKVRREVGALQEIWWGVTHWDEVQEGHRRLDEQAEEREAESRLRLLAGLAGDMGSDLLAEAHDVTEHEVGFQRLPRSLRMAATALTVHDHVETVSNLLEVLGGVDDADEAWRALRENPTDLHARDRVCREMGDLLPAVGRLLGALPLPPGASDVVGLLEHCDASFFMGMVRKIDANPDRWRRQGLCADPDSAFPELCGDGAPRTQRGIAH